MSRQTGSGHAADSEMRYTRQFSILTSVSNNGKLASVVPEKNVTEIILWANLPLSTIFKDASNMNWCMPQTQNCVTRYSSPYWCSVPNIRKLASVVSEKNMTEIILWANLPKSTILKVASNRKFQIQKCVTRYSFPYWCSVPNIRKLVLCGSREKCDRNFLWRRHQRRRKTTEVIPICRLR